MDKASQTLFDRLMGLGLHELQPWDIEFLKARQTYLSDEQRARLAEVLGLEKPKPKKAEK